MEHARYERSSHPRTAIDLPTLTLPRFQLQSVTARAEHPPEARVPAQRTIPAPTHSPVRYQQPAPVHPPVIRAAMPARVHTYSFTGSGAVALPRTSGISPTIIGIACALMMVAFVIANGPRTQLTATPAALPALPNAAPVGSAHTATLPLERAPQGIPSPAAAASIRFERTGALPLQRTDLPMRGMPSPAAAQSIAPQTLAMVRDDGVTLPDDSAARDTYSSDVHYGNYPGEHVYTPAPDQPLVTPGQAQAAAEQAKMQQLIPSDSSDMPPGASMM